MFARGETIVFLDTPSPRSKLIRNDEYETMSLFLVKIEKIPRSFFFPLGKGRVPMLKFPSLSSLL